MSEVFRSLQERRSATAVATSPDLPDDALRVVTDLIECGDTMGAWDVLKGLPRHDLDTPRIRVILLQVRRELRRMEDRTFRFANRRVPVMTTHAGHAPTHHVRNAVLGVIGMCLFAPLAVSWFLGTGVTEDAAADAMVESVTTLLASDAVDGDGSQAMAADRP